jgi:AcrR family transcriptional regulator
MDTRARLLLRARELFNERGLEEVGVRDLARDLGLSPGNVSYHFPKKEDLVRALMDELREANAPILRRLHEAPTLDAFLTCYRGTFENQHAWRFAARSVVHVVNAYPSLGEPYRAVEASRRRAIAGALRSLRDHGELVDLDEAALARVVGTCTLVARFWLSEYGLSFPDQPHDRVIDHYLALLAHALAPFAAPHARGALDHRLARVLPQTLG